MSVLIGATPNHHPIRSYGRKTRVWRAEWAESFVGPYAIS